MGEIKTAKVKEAVYDEENVTIDEKVKLRDRVSESKPVSFVKRHAKGFVAGAATVVAIGAAAVAGAKLAAHEARCSPIELETIPDSVPFDQNGDDA